MHVSVSRQSADNGEERFVNSIVPRANMSCYHLFSNEKSAMMRFGGQKVMWFDAAQILIPLLI